MHVELAELRAELLRTKRRFCQPTLRHIRAHGQMVSAGNVDEFSKRRYLQKHSGADLLLATRTHVLNRNPILAIGRNLKKKGWSMQFNNQGLQGAVFQFSKGPINANFLVHAPFLVHVFITSSSDQLAQRELELAKAAHVGMEGATHRSTASHGVAVKLREVELLEESAQTAERKIGAFAAKLRREMGVRKLRVPRK